MAYPAARLQSGRTTDGRGSSCNESRAVMAPFANLFFTFRRKPFSRLVTPMFGWSIWQVMFVTGFRKGVRKAPTMHVGVLVNKAICKNAGLLAKTSKHKHQLAHRVCGQSIKHSIVMMKIYFLLL